MRLQAGLETQDEKKAKAAAEREAEKERQREEKEAEKARKAAAKKAERENREKEKAEKEAAKGPKQPMTAYFYYMSEVREEVKARLQAEDPSKKPSIGDIAKATSAQWKALSDEDKAPYNAKNAEDKVRYEREKQEHDAKMKTVNAKKEKAEAAAKLKAAEAARKAELKAAADLGGGDSQWFEDYVEAAHKIESMANVAPGEDGIKTFFFELLGYDVPTLEQAVPGMHSVALLLCCSAFLRLCLAVSVSLSPTHSVSLQAWRRSLTERTPRLSRT